MSSAFWVRLAAQPPGALQQVWHGFQSARQVWPSCSPHHGTSLQLLEFMLISPRKGKYRYYTTVQAVRCFPKLASPKQLTVGTCAAFFFAISVGRLLNRRAGTRFWRRSEASKKAKLQAALRSATDRLTAERIPSSCQFSRETSRRVRRKANLFSQP